MKVIQINATGFKSSTGRTTKELHKFLLNKGQESWICATDVPDSENTIKIGNQFDHKLHALYSRLTNRQGFFSKKATKKLIRRLNCINPDIVHLRNLHTNYINLPILLNFLSRKKIPTVLTLHDFWPMTGHCCYFTDTECKKWQYGCGKCPDLKNWNPSWFFDRTQKNINDKLRLFNSIDKLAVIGVSDWATEFIKFSILCKATIIKRIYNWIDPSIFYPQNTIKLKDNLKLKEKPVILGVAQTWSVQKGLNDFIELAKLIPEAEFILIGKLQSSTTDLPSNIRTIGTVENSTILSQYYSLADIFFNPSYRETFGKVTVEALACGTPVVAYNTTATAELIDTKNGFLIKPNNILEAKEKMNYILTHQTEYKRQDISNQAHQTFGKSKLCNDYLDLYQELLNS